MYNCAACAKQPALKETLGHDGPPTNLWRDNLLTGEPLARCPVRTLQLADPEVVAELDRYLSHYWPAYGQGHLLVSGGVAEQPARYLEMIAAIRDVSDQAAEKYTELTTPDEAPHGR